MPGSEVLAADAGLLFAAVREAGDMAHSMQRQRFKSWHKGDGSPVCEVDLAVDQLLQERLRQSRPDYGWLSEETPDSAARIERRCIWIADPIDGTRAFLRGDADWCVAVALVRDGQPVAAAIHRPAVDEFFSAVTGGGARLNGQHIAVRNGNGLSGARVAGPRKAMAQLEPRGAIAAAEHNLALQLRLAFVAAGRVDAAVSLGRKNDWDLAAGDLLVREAGGWVSDTQGAGYIYNRREPWQQGLAAAGPSRHAALVEALTGL